MYVLLAVVVLFVMSGVTGGLFALSFGSTSGFVGGFQAGVYLLAGGLLGGLTLICLAVMLGAVVRGVRDELARQRAEKAKGSKGSLREFWRE